MEILLIIITIIKDLLLTVFFYSVFFIFGEALLKILKIKVSDINSVYVQPILGALSFGLVSYVFAWSQLRILSLPLVLAVLYLIYKKNLIKFPKIKISGKFSIGLVVLLALIFSLNMTGMGIYGTTIAYRGEDPVHLAYINELKAHFPPDNPGISGVPLRGYHFFYQFLNASLSSTFYVSVEALYFHILPLIVSFAWAFGVYGIVLTWTKKKSAALWATFFSMFGGSFGFILIFQGYQKISVDSVFGIGQPTVALINPQFAFSVPVIFTAFYFIYRYLKDRSYNLLFPIVLCAGLLPLIKVYGGIIFYPAFGLVVFSDILKRRFKSVLFVGMSVLLSLLTFGLFLGTGQRLIYYPLWPSHTVMDSNLPWYGYTEKSYTYTRLGVIKGIIEIESFGLMLYFIGNLGVRVIGVLFAFLGLLYKRRLPSLFSLTLFAATFTSVIIPLFFIQTGKVFETIQFAWYYPIFCSFFAGLGFSYFFSLRFPKILKIIIATIIIVLALPPAYDHFRASGIPDIVTKRESMKNPYFTGMQYLKGVGNYNDTVLELPAPTWELKKVPDWFFKSSPHITAFGDKRTYANYQFIVFDNVRPAERFPLVKELLAFTSARVVRDNKTKEHLVKNLKNAGISYIYAPNKLPILSQYGIATEVFHNSQAYIYKVK